MTEQLIVEELVSNGINTGSQSDSMLRALPTSLLLPFSWKSLPQCHLFRNIKLSLTLIRHFWTFISDINFKECIATVAGSVWVACAPPPRQPRLIIIGLLQECF